MKITRWAIFAYMIGLIFLSQGEAAQCPEGAHWVRSHFRRAYLRADGTSVSSAEVRAHCRANPPSFEYLKSRFREGRPLGWPHRGELVGHWTEEEKERLLDTMSSISPQLWDNKLLGFYRFKKSKDFPNPSSWGRNVIVLYDSAFDKNRNLSRIVVHELGHQQFGTDAILALDYRRGTGWGYEIDDKTRLIFYKRREGGFITNHAQENPGEDFATNLEYYLFEPEQLNAKAPKVYTWMKNRFGDKLKVVR